MINDPFGWTGWLVFCMLMAKALGIDILVYEYISGRRLKYLKSPQPDLSVLPKSARSHHLKSVKWMKTMNPLR